MNKYIQQSKCPRNHCGSKGHNHQCLGLICWCGKEHQYTSDDLNTPPHKEHGEGLEDWAKEFVKIRVKHRGEAYGGIAIAIEEYDFISQLLLSTQQEAVEKERERIKTHFVQYWEDDRKFISVKEVLDYFTPKETI